MKRKNKSIMAMLLVIAVICCNMNIISGNAKKKVNIKKIYVTVGGEKIKKLTLKQGVVKKLKVTVKVSPNKKKYKNVKYKSSKKKIVSVNQNGIIKALKPGTAKITITSRRNKKKKAIIKVTVVEKDTTTQSNGTTGDSNNSNAQKDNSTSNSQNNSNTGNTTLKPNVTPTPMSTPSLSTEGCFIEDKVVRFTVGEDYHDYYQCFGNTEEDEHITNTLYEVSDLPSGIQYNNEGWEDRNCLVIEGNPTQAGTYHSVLKATKENGDTYAVNLFSIIGSENKIAGVGAPVYDFIMHDYDGVVCAGNCMEAYFTGGSGEYDYEIISTDVSCVEIEDIYYDSDVEARCIDIWYDIDNVAKNNYYVTVRATDVNNSSLYTDVTIPIYLKEQVVISDCVTDEVGNPLTHAEIRFINHNHSDRWSGFETSIQSENDKGNFDFQEFDLAPGVYDIEIYRGKFPTNDDFYDYNGNYDENYSSLSLSKRATIRYMFNNIELSREVEDLDLELSIPSIYSVKLTSEEELRLTSIDWKDNGEYITLNEDDYSNNLFLPNGTYDLTSKTFTSFSVEDWFKGGEKIASPYHYEVTFTVEGAPIEKEVTKVEEPLSVDVYGGAKNTTYIAETDIEYELSEAGNFFGYKFTPNETSYYYIKNNQAKIYDETGESLWETSASFYDYELDKYIRDYPLTEGTTYYIGNEGRVEGKFTLIKSDKTYN